MSFDEFCRVHGCTYAEKDALAWQLAMRRARALYEQIRPQPKWPRDSKVRGAQS